MESRSGVCQSTGPIAATWVDGSDPDSRLRISLVGGCNYRCFFCHNEGELAETLSGAQPTLQADDLAFVAEAAVRAGITAVKVTGGEPLAYRAGSATVVDAVAAIRRGAGNAPLDVSMTTNGQLLKRFAEPLAAAGLDRVTVSIHTLDQERFREDISASGSVSAQLAGLVAAQTAGLSPIKVNFAVYRGRPSGTNVGELPALVDRLRQHGVAEMRLYQVLWTPVMGAGYRRHHVPNSVLAELLCQALDEDANRSELVHLLERTNASASGRRSLRLVGRDGFAVVLDVMPLQGSAWEGDQEGDYALRLSASGHLRSHLFTEGEGAFPDLVRRRDTQGAVAAITNMRNKLHHGVVRRG
ncbi:radical SAM protein [Kribbella sp. NPDC023855]|uniref:radical SAM protein n=1 Tax=Kribbella sp. NPDC023855 TaxID=3154698 RepID=UPI0033E379B3